MSYVFFYPDAPSAPVFFMYAYVFILMHSNVFLSNLMKEQRYCDTAGHERTNRL